MRAALKDTCHHTILSTAYCGITFGLALDAQQPRPCTALNQLVDAALKFVTLICAKPVLTARSYQFAHNGCSQSDRARGHLVVLTTRSAVQTIRDPINHTVKSIDQLARLIFDRAKLIAHNSTCML